ncbi:unnamed protein product [Rhodiola kirilowii]
MSEPTPCEIPNIDFSGETGWRTANWGQICKMVREACEEYGFFQVRFDEILPELVEETFEIVRGMFNLSAEIKEMNKNPKPYHGYYLGNLYESFGIEDASNLTSLSSFEKLMWPDGNDRFCQAMIPITKQLNELQYTILRAVVDSYGLREEDGSKTDVVAQCKTLMRLMKYKPPPPGTSTDGLGAHTDKPLCVILFADKVSGLQVQKKDGQWLNLSQPPNSFVFMVGDPLMAWSNGRLHAARHRVRMSGNEERYSIGTFLVPVEGTIIKSPKELVDEAHPQFLKDFDYFEFINFSYTKEAQAIDSAKQLVTFAAIN